MHFGQQHIAFISDKRAGKQLDGCGLAGTGWPDDRSDFAGQRTEATLRKA